MVAQIDGAYLQIAPGRAWARLVSYALFEGRPVTVRGQWINPLVFAHLGVEKRLPIAHPVRAPIYVVGMGRSGTTILGVVLSVHRDVGFLNEPKAMWHAVHGAEDVIGSYTRAGARYRLGEMDATPEVRRAAHRVFGAYTLLVRRSRVVDKYPEMIFRVPFVRAIFPDARFIFLTRNGWDACASIEAWSIRNGEQVGAENHDWWGVDGRKWRLLREELVKSDPALAPLHDLVDGIVDHRVMAAVEWIVTMREGLRAAAAHPAAFLTVRYEELVAAPRAVLSGLLDACALSRDEACLQYAEKVLAPSRPYPRFEMPPAVRALFDETSGALGYPV